MPTKKTILICTVAASVCLVVVLDMLIYRDNGMVNRTLTVINVNPNNTYYTKHRPPEPALWYRRQSGVGTNMDVFVPTSSQESNLTAGSDVTKFIPIHNNNHKDCPSHKHGAADVGNHFDIDFLTISDGVLEMVPKTIELKEHEMVHLIQDDRSVAVGGGLRMPKCQENKAFDESPLFKDFLPSFCSTIQTSKYNFYIIFAYDFNDPCLQDAKRKDAMLTKMQEFLTANCPVDKVKRVHIFPVQYTGKPAWAQNDAMVEAYWLNISYFYRINDDSVMQSNNWADAMISTLQNYKPTRLGVTGPHHSGGNTGILTYDFTHRTHIDAHGYLYPRHFTDWWADTWITKGYSKMSRMIKMSSVKLKHTLRKGQRYRTHSEKKAKLQFYVDLSSDIIKGWMDYLPAKSVVCRNTELQSTSCGISVISMSLNIDDSNHIRGALRNVVLTKRLLPDWQIRVYVGQAIPALANQMLQQYGAEVVLVDVDVVQIPAVYWPYFIAEDPCVARFLIRSPTHRLSPRQTNLINTWMESGKSYHGIRDRDSHAAYPIVPDLFGAVREPFANSFGGSFYSILKHAGEQPMEGHEYLANVIWPHVQNDVLYHDSTGTVSSGELLQFSRTSFDAMKIGQAVDQHEQEL